MSTASIVLSFLGGSAVGAIGAAGVTAWHNSTERLRDRMVAAAEAFLVAVAEARSALWAVQMSAHELLDAKMTAEAYQVVAVERAEALDAELIGAPPDVHQRAFRMIRQVGEISDGQHNPLDRARRAEAERTIEAAHLMP